MNYQTVAILVTDKISEAIDKRLNDMPSERVRVRIKWLKTNITLYYWEYEPFFNRIDKRLHLLDLLSDYDDNIQEGYKLLAYGDDDFKEIRENKVGAELFSDYYMEYRFNFLDNIKINQIKDLIDNIKSNLNDIDYINESLRQDEFLD